MNKLAVSANTLWLYAVLVHIAGSIVVNGVVMLPFGSILFMTVLWISMFILYDKKRKYVIPFVAGWFLSIYVIYQVPASYEGSFLLNGMILFLIWYVCRLKEVKPTEFCHVKKIPIRQWGFILLITIGLIVIAGYINGLSMLVFYNGTTSSLQEVGKYFPESVIVFALVPAISEEFLFRGCIYQEVAGTNTKQFAVFLSAVLFALLHMNFNQMSYAFIMGLFFGWIICMTDNLSISILIHALFNCFSVFSFAFQNNALMKLIMNLHVGAYYIFNPILRDNNGKIIGEAVVEGAILLLCMLIFVGALLYFLKKDNEKRMPGKQIRVKTGFGKPQIEEYGQKDESILWKADREFWTGCIGCIIFAILYELFMMSS